MNNSKFVGLSNFAKSQYRAGVIKVTSNPYFTVVEGVPDILPATIEAYTNASDQSGLKEYCFVSVTGEIVRFMVNEGKLAAFDTNLGVDATTGLIHGQDIVYTISNSSGSTGPETDPIFLAEKGQPDGVATLNAAGVVPASELEIVFQDPIYGSVATTDKTGRVDSVANWGYLTNKATLTDTDIFYIADFANNINHSMTPQAVANYVSTKLSTLTKIPGGTVDGASTSAGSTVVAAQPATTLDGSYLVVQTAGYVTINGGTPKKLSVGDKLLWNATDAEYIIIPAGENQEAVDVPVNPVLPSPTTAGFAGPTVQLALEQIAQELKKKYYNITQTWEINAFKSSQSPYPNFGSALANAERKTIVVAHDPLATSIQANKTVLRIINPITIDCNLIINELDDAGGLVASHLTIPIPASATSQVIVDNSAYIFNAGNYLQYETDCYDNNVGAELVIITQEF